MVVADDGTVSVLSPNDKYTIIRARTASGGYANTPATVHAISWRLAEMMLLILAADGSLAVWDIRSGQLERCALFLNYQLNFLNPDPFTCISVQL